MGKLYCPEGEHIVKVAFEPTEPVPVELRLLDKIDFTQGDCWLWTAGKTPQGYGSLRADGKKTVAHRVVYELVVGPIGAGLHLDHLCEVRHCVNPAHLDPVTCWANVHRGNGIAARESAKTHCHKGHELAGDNLYVYPNGKRRCRQRRRESEARA